MTKRRYLLRRGINSQRSHSLSFTFIHFSVNEYILFTFLFWLAHFLWTYLSETLAKGVPSLFFGHFTELTSQKLGLPFKAGPIPVKLTQWNTYKRESLHSSLGLSLSPSLWKGKKKEKKLLVSKRLEHRTSCIKGINFDQNNNVKTLL